MDELKVMVDNLYFMSDKSIPYDLCEQIVKEITENRKPDAAVLVRRKVCKKCGRTFMYWEERFLADNHREIHNEKITCDKCGGKLEDKRIWNGRMF